MGNITSTDSRRSGGSNSDVLAAAAEGRPQKRIKLTSNNKSDNVGSPKHTSVSSNTRSARGNGANNTDNEDDDIELALPAECYALVLEYLDYQTVLSCALTSKVFLHDAMPLIKTLHIDTALQMNIPLAARFRDVQHINLYSLLKGRVAEDNNEELLSVNYDAVLRVIPFLGQFGNLQRVFIGGRKINGDIVAFCSKEGLYHKEEDARRVHTLIDMISGSYESAGGILKNVQVMGLRCPCRYSREDRDEDENDENQSECEVCVRACRSFPIDQVVNFDNEGSSVGSGGLFSCKRTHCLDVCLSRSVIEGIVEERPGGNDILHSNKRLLHLLGRGSLSEICSDGGRSLLIVKYTSKEKAELKRVIEYAESNADLMSSDEVQMSNEDVTRAIWHSFAKGEGYKIPPKDRCYLARSSLNFLTSSNELGLIMDRKEFGLEAANIRNMTQIVKGLMIGNPVTSYCLSLLKNLLNNLGEEASTTIQKVVNLGVVPALVRLLEHNKSSVQSDALFALIEITLKGNDNNAQILVDAGVVPVLVMLLSTFATRTDIKRELVLILGLLASTSTAIRDIALQEGALEALLNQPGIMLYSPKSNKYILQSLEYLLLGESPPNLDEYDIDLEVLSERIEEYNYNIDEPMHFACTALSYICHTPSKHRQAVIKAGLFPRLLKAMNVLSPEVQLPALETIRILLREDSSLIEAVIDTGKVSFQCLLSPVVEVRVEACEVILVLLNGTIRQVDILVAQGCIRALCGCGLNDLDHPVLIITSLMSLMKILKHRMTEANPEGIDILDGEIKCIKDKLDELDCEIDSSTNEWKELKSLVGVVRDELEGKNVNYKEGDSADTKETAVDTEGSKEDEEPESTSGETEEKDTDDCRVVRAFIVPSETKGDLLAGCDREQELRFDKSTIHGWGVFAGASINADDMIIEYRGDVIHKSEADNRELEYEKRGIDNYMFRLDESTVCDATKTPGNIARYINASCSPNCYAQIITSGKVKRIVIYAMRGIKTGEELCYNYNFNIENDQSKRIPCNCGSNNCKGYLN